MTQEPTKLVELNLERAYRSASHLLGRDFLAELLGASSRYRRAAGFFSSTVFGVAPEAFVGFVKRGGTMKLICCPRVSPQDAQGFAKGIFRRRESRALSSLETIDHKTIGRGFATSEMLAWLISSDILTVKIARIPNARGTEIYHEKIGIFDDQHDGSVSFVGSANESSSAYVGNFERIDVYSSFAADTERRRAAAITHQFEDLWNNTTPGLEVTPLGDALRQGLIEIAPDRDLPTETSPKPFASLGLFVTPETLSPPPGLEIRPHQRAAISDWATAGGKGLLEMATGAGKTITALSLASRLFDRTTTPLGILIIAPYIHLVDQWIEVAERFGLKPVRCAEGKAEWYAELSAGVHTLNSGRRPILSIATTSATLLSDAFQDLIRSIRQPLLVIGDEAHNFGAAKTFAALPQNAMLRVGLSATPERAHDEIGTGRIKEYFGDTVYRYTLKDALRDGILTPYRYHPQIVTLQEDEVDEYLKLSLLIARNGGAEDREGPAGEILKSLLIKRARLLGRAREKIPALRHLLGERREESHILVYVGDGSVEEPATGEVTRQVDECVRMIGHDLGMRCARYTAETPPARRKELLDEFGSGDLQVLVAIRCLDEGVDVPATRTAFLLASSTNPRQFIQRRGRVLRTFPGKQRANIYDFFVSLPRGQFRVGERDFGAARNLIRSQLARSSEFAELAENGPVASERLLDLRRHFELIGEG